MKKLAVLLSLLLLAGCGQAAEPEVEVTAEPEPPAQTETPAENDAARAVYAETLTTLLNENRLPDGGGDAENYANTEEERANMAENRFAVYDVDGDGREELVIDYVTSSMAGMAGLVCDTEDGELRLQLFEFPALTFYDNGAVQADWSHNQGKAGDFWPYTLYLYNGETDRYTTAGSVDAWSRDLWPEDYPTDIDAGGAGIVYYIYRDLGTEYDQTDPVDEGAYLRWREQYLAGAAVLDLPWQSLTAENIQSLTAAG